VHGSAVPRVSASTLGAFAVVLFFGLQSATAAPIVQSFENFPVGTPIDTQIPGIIVFAPAGQAVVVRATTPLFPSEPQGLISRDDQSAPLLITFSSSVTFAGAAIDFGNDFAGLRLTAFSGPAGMGDLVDAVTTQREGFLSVSGQVIRSIVFEEGDLGSFSTFLIDNLTYEFIPEPSTASLILFGLALQATSRRGSQVGRRPTKQWS